MTDSRTPPGQVRGDPGGNLFLSPNQKICVRGKISGLLVPLNIEICVRWYFQGEVNFCQSPEHENWCSEGIEVSGL